jgi:hypothetical protein
MSEAAARLAAATSKSWLDLENFMRIFRQQGHPRALQKNLVISRINSCSSQGASCEPSCRNNVF